MTDQEHLGANLETEVKFAVQDLNALRDRLLAAGAELAQPRVLEVNLRLDNLADELRAAGKVLRLRQDTRTRLTLKTPVGPWGTEAKTLRELELEVGDFKVAEQMLVELGFHVWFIYEKYRESYHLAGTEISLDELPFGSFVEIEGSMEGITAVAGLLDLDGTRRITAGYWMLFQDAKERLDLPFDDCTFAAWSEYKEFKR
jgi:adenylate cyclase class 2